MSSTKRNKGFTLVEVIVGMLLLTIIIVSVLSAFSSAAKNSLAVKKQRSAETLAANVMEYAKAGGENFATIFGGTAEPVSGGTESVVLRGVSEGFFTYDIEIEKDYDVVEYDKAMLNDYKEVLLGNSDENIALINLSEQGSAWDGQAISTFYDLHVRYVDSYNAQQYDEWLTQWNEQQEEIEEGVTPTPTPIPTPVAIQAMEQSEFPAKIVRELIITADPVSYGKMQLRAELCYTLAAEVPIPEGAGRSFFRQVYRSKVYDSGNDVFAGDDCLDRVMVLYSPFCGGSSTVDIRVLDTQKVLDAKLFLVWSETARKDLDAELFEQVLEDRTSGHYLRMSFFSQEGHFYEPYHLDVYSSVNINEEICSSVEYHMHSLIAKGQTKRIAAVKVKVYDPETGETVTQVSSAYTR